MVQDIFIGVDGGGTKSKVRIENHSGEVLGQAIGGPANIRLSVDKSWESIYQAVEDSLKPVNLSLDDKHYRYHIGLGLAGCEVTEALNTFLTRSHPFTTLELFSDAHAACLGAHGGKDGSIIVIGTGVVGYQIEDQQGTQISGWGFPHDDEGSGAWLGLEAARMTFQWIDHRAEKSPLVEDVFSFFNQDLEHFVDWANKANSSEFARLAPLVINHSQQEEVAAVRLMKRAAHAIDRVAHAFNKNKKNPETVLPCSLFGGIAPFVEPWLNEDVRATLVPREADANVGAVLMIRNAVMKSRA